MQTRPSPRPWSLWIGIVAVALIALLVFARLHGAANKRGGEATGPQAPAPVSAWEVPVAKTQPAVAPVDPNAPVDPKAQAPGEPKKVLTQEEIDSGKW